MKFFKGKYSFIYIYIILQCGGPYFRSLCIIYASPPPTSASAVSDVHIRRDGNFKIYRARVYGGGGNLQFFFPIYLRDGTSGRRR